ncbi:MAG: Asp-tRNA(Asn)/Glu-tRNA(Gln) amidotransferase GatCAB subunit C [Candidatus Parabeggiatoa sp. nov. 1]|nr:MAG: Asp-tRNA(Asn)/Glu-tRNA(Gln) amidotransferase GatCAB subunit C [Gammaproteobacteria bacterium]
MSFSKIEVEKMAHLARISFKSPDIPLYTHHLSNILDFVEQMNSVDTTGITPMAHPLDAQTRLRADIVSETNLCSHFQTIAPQVNAGLYLVPKVIE